MRRYVIGVVVGVALLQALWIAVVPPFRGSDEFDHAYRAAGVAVGQWRATEVPDDGRGLLVRSPASLVEAAHAQCAALPHTGPDNCSPAEDLGDGTVLVGSGAGGYHPAYYVIVGLVGSTFEGSTSLYVMRVTSALICLVFMGLAAWAAAIRAVSAWSRISLVLAMTPVMLYSTSIVAPNGLEMAAALALWSALLAFDGTPSRRQERILIWLAGASAAVLMVDRTLGPVFVLSILLTVGLWMPRHLTPLFRRHRASLLAVSALVLMAALWGTYWFLSSGAGAPADGPKQAGRFRWSFLILWPLQTIAAFPFRDQAGSPLIYPIVMTAFLVLVVLAARWGDTRARRTLGMTLAVSVAIPLILTLATYEGRGAMWQGRYGLPYSAGVVLVAGAVLDRQAWSTRWRVPALRVGGAAMAVGWAACLGKVLNDEMDRPVSINDATWVRPPVALVVLGATLAWFILCQATSLKADSRGG